MGARSLAGNRLDHARRLNKCPGCRVRGRRSGLCPAECTLNQGSCVVPLTSGIHAGMGILRIAEHSSLLGGVRVHFLRMSTQVVPRGNQFSPRGAAVLDDVHAYAVAVSQSNKIFPVSTSE